MTERTSRRVAASAVLGVCGLALSGCMSSPTYGTDKTATEQLVGDVSGILSIAPKERPNIDYKPRPELVKPTKGEVGNLPAPQETAAVTSNPAWPESPEQRRARLRADATENRDKPGFRPQIENDVAVASAPKENRSDRSLESGIVPTGSMATNRKNQRDDFNRRLASTRQGSETSRRSTIVSLRRQRRSAMSARTRRRRKEGARQPRRAARAGPISGRSRPRV